jgi:hypothetical protein
MVHFYKYYVFGHIHRLVFNQKPSYLYLKHNVSETEFCPRIQVKPTLLDPPDTASPYLRTIFTTAIMRSWCDRFVDG